MSGLPRIVECKNVLVFLSEGDRQRLEQLTDKAEMPDLSKLIETDQNGLITVFSPVVMPMELLFFIQQLMVKQRLYLIDNFLKEQKVIK